MRTSPKQDAVAELVEELARDAVAELVCDLVRNEVKDDALVLARYQGRIAEQVRRRSWKRHQLQRFADIIRGRPPGRL